jgi:hypothetical protein
MKRTAAKQYRGLLPGAACQSTLIIPNAANMRTKFPRNTVPADADQADVQIATADDNSCR